MEMILLMDALFNAFAPTTMCTKSIDFTILGGYEATQSVEDILVNLNMHNFFIDPLPILLVNCNLISCNLFQHIFQIDFNIHSTVW